MEKKIYIASSSKSRKELAFEYKLDWIFIPNKFDEENEKHNFKVDNFNEACNYTKKLSYGKAMSVAKDIKGIIVGCDSVVYIKGKLLEKPKNRDEFEAMIKLLCTFPHYLVTGVTIANNIDNKIYSFNEITKLFFEQFTEQEKNDLIEKYHAFDNAGGYTINSCIADKVHIIKGTRNNVIGLPIERIQYEIDNM